MTMARDALEMPSTVSRVPGVTCPDKFIFTSGNGLVRDRREGWAIPYRLPLTSFRRRYPEALTAYNIHIQWVTVQPSPVS